MSDAARESSSKADSGVTPRRHARLFRFVIFYYLQQNAYCRNTESRDPKVKSDRCVVNMLHEGNG